MPSIGNYVDAACTTLHDARILLSQDDQGILPPATRRGFIASLDAAGTLFQVKAAPGVDPVLLGVRSVATGQPVESCKLASTLAGLETAVAGAPLNLGTVLESGVENAKEWWLEWDDASGEIGTYDNLELYLPELSVTLP